MFAVEKDSVLGMYLGRITLVGTSLCTSASSVLGLVRSLWVSADGWIPQRQMIQLCFNFDLPRSRAKPAAVNPEDANSISIIMI